MPLLHLKYSRSLHTQLVEGTFRSSCTSLKITSVLKKWPCRKFGFQGMVKVVMSSHQQILSFNVLSNQKGSVVGKSFSNVPQFAKSYRINAKLTSVPLTHRKHHFCFDFQLTTHCSKYKIVNWWVLWLHRVERTSITTARTPPHRRTLHLTRTLALSRFTLPTQEAHLVVSTHWLFQSSSASLRPRPHPL